MKIVLLILVFKAYALQIIGEDNRIRITDASKDYFSQVGFISRGCSGILVSNKHVLTAAHCIYVNKEFEKKLNFSLGITEGKQLEQVSYRWKKAFLLNSYIEKEETQNDFAIIELEDEIKSFDAKAKLAKFVTADLLSIVGYPSDKDSYSMWRSECSQFKTEEQRLAYDCDTVKGMSGAGIVIKDGAFFKVIGVHSGETTRTTNGKISEHMNQGVLFSQSLLEIIDSWMQASVGIETKVIENDTRYEFKFYTDCDEAIDLKILNENNSFDIYYLSSEEGVSVLTENPYIYFRADAKNYSFSGAFEFEIEGQVIKFDKIKLNKGAYSSINFKLNCTI